MPITPIKGALSATAVILMTAVSPLSAGTSLRELLAIEPGHVRANQMLGKFLAQRGEFDTAIEHLSLAVQSMPDDFGARIHLGVAWSMKGDAKEAIRHLREAIRMNPGSALAHENLAWVLRSLEGNIEEAVAEHRKTLELSPN